MNYQDMKRSRPLARLGGSIAGLSARSRLEASVAAPEQAPLGTWLGSVGRLVRVSRALVRVRVSRAYWLALLAVRPYAVRSCNAFGARVVTCCRESSSS